MANDLIQADPFSANPLVEDATLTRNHLVELASREAPAPTLFMTGDLPPFTASGVAPEVLSRIPFRARHAAAAEPDPAAVLGMVEKYGSDPAWEFEHEGLDAYRTRVHDWLAGNNVPQSQRVDAGDDLYDAMFGEEERAKQAAKDRSAALIEAEKDHTARITELRGSMG